MSDIERLNLRIAELDEQHKLRMAELDERMLRFENGLAHLLEVSTRNSIALENIANLAGKIGTLILQHEERIKKLETE